MRYFFELHIFLSEISLKYVWSKFTTCHTFALIFLVCLGFKKEELFKVAWPRPKYTFTSVRYCFQSRPIKRESVHETSVTWTKQVIRFWSCKLATKLNSSFFIYRLWCLGDEILCLWFFPAPDQILLREYRITIVHTGWFETKTINLTNLVCLSFNFVILM